MKTDAILQRDVQDALNFEPTLTAGQIGVIAANGIVTLTGVVDSYSKKLHAEKAVRRVKGVRAVAEKIQVQLSQPAVKTDTGLAGEIVNALRWNFSIPDDKIIVRVENGHVTLDGSVAWDYQRKAAGKEVARINGVTGITNNLTLQSEATDSVEKNAIDEAISRHWSLDAADIYVRVKDNIVTLAGEVDSLYQKDEAERIAWQVPGVQAVENQLEVEHKLAKY